MKGTISKKASWLFSGMVLMTMVALTASPAGAEDKWTGSAGDGLWSNDINWHLGYYPPPGETAAIDNGDTVTFDDIDTYLSNPLGKLRINTGSALDQSDGSTYLGVINVQIGIDGNGTYSQSAGIHNVIAGDYDTDPYDGTGVLSLGIEGGSIGIYNLSGQGSLSVGWWEYVGYSGEGYFNQRDATSTHTVTDDLNLGYNFGSYGEYNLYDGTLNARFQYIGGDNGGAGVFNQTGGTNTADNQLIVGAGAWNPVGEGTYNLSGGGLTAGEEFVGFCETGTFNQKGGDHDINGGYSAPNFSGDLIGLDIGSKMGSSGNYTLTGGILDVTNLTVVGNEGTGVFNLGMEDPDYPGSYMGSGTHNTPGVLVGFNGGTGYYNLYSGTLNVGGIVIGGKDYNPVAGFGEFSQFGGTNTTGGLWIGDSVGSIGTYNIFGGDLTIWQWDVIGMRGAGTINQYGGTHNAHQTLEVGGAGNGTYNLVSGNVFTNGTIVGNWGTGVFNQGYRPDTDESGDGGNHTVNGDLVLGANVGTSGTYKLVGGTLSTNFLQLGQGGYGEFVQTSGTVNVTGGVALAGNTSGTGEGTYDLWSGTLSSGNTQVGSWGEGTFNQYGGAHTTGWMDIGGAYDPGTGVQGHGVYNLTGGDLNVAGNTGIGVDGIGTFNLDGGSHETTSLKIGIWSQSVGEYNLISGDLVIGDEMMGGGTFDLADYGNATFIQTGGTNMVNGAFFIGAVAGKTAHYELTDGALDMNGSEEKIGGMGISSFKQTGGSHTFDTIYLGDQSGETGIYYMEGGTLDGGGLSLGEWGGTGNFYQTGGGVTVNNLQLARQNFPNLSNGNYELSGDTSTLTIIHNMEVGGNGIGDFTQTGGTNSVGETLTIAVNPVSSGGTAQGTYNLEGGTLNATNIVNNDTFNYSGGTLNAANTITNNGTTTLSGAGTRTVNGAVTNNGTFKVTDTDAIFSGTFTNNSTYISDPSTQIFEDLIINDSGYLVAGTVDEFIINGNFVNYSDMNIQWETDLASIAFGSGSTVHEFHITGLDMGSGLGGYHDNFSWHSLSIVDTFLQLFDENAPGGALYVDIINGVLFTDQLVDNIIGNGLNIYYNPTENSYLNGQTFALVNGGFLAPSAVPIPPSVILFATGIFCLVGIRRWRKKD